MTLDPRQDLYQQMILEHNKNPRNLRKLEDCTHHAEGYNPLCGDHLTVYVKIDDNNNIADISFVGDGCAISKASASMMTTSLKGKSPQETQSLFDQFHKLIKGDLNPDRDQNDLGKLSVFSGIWQYPARVKCASLSWHTMKAALEKIKSTSTE